MKMSNDDLKRITVIKQYLLDPPTSFKLNEYAVTYLQNAISVLKSYPSAANTIEDFQTLIYQLQNNLLPPQNLRSTLKESGKQIGYLTSK